jgi:hypothetical protein
MTRRRRRRYDDTLPTARTTLRTGCVRVLVFCNSCRHQADANLQAIIDAGRGDVPLTELQFRCSQCGTDRTDFVVTWAAGLAISSLAPGVSVCHFDVAADCVLPCIDQDSRQWLLAAIAIGASFQILEPQRGGRSDPWWVRRCPCANRRARCLGRCPSLKASGAELHHLAGPSLCSALAIPCSSDVRRHRGGCRCDPRRLSAA